MVIEPTVRGMNSRVPWAIEMESWELRTRSVRSWGVLLWDWCLTLFYPGLQVESLPFRRWVLAHLERQGWCMGGQIQGQAVMDQMFATIQLQLQLQQTQQGTLAKLLAQQAHVQRIMCEIMRGLVHCNGSTASVKGRRVKQRDMETMMKKLDQLTQQLHQPQLLPSNGQSQATDDGASGTTTGSLQLRSPGAAKGERKCWLCGARGDNFHLSSDCPNGRERSCYTCGAKGPDFHLSRSCPQHQGNGQLLA